MAEKQKATAVVMVVNAPNGLNLREAPNGEPVAIIPNETEVKIGETVGKWVAVQVKRQKGWVMQEYLQKKGAK
jgi:SH3-like domain-containing protein